MERQVRHQMVQPSELSRLQPVVYRPTICPTPTLPPGPTCQTAKLLRALFASKRE